MIYDPTRIWNIAATEIVLPNDNGHFLYLKVPKEELLTTSELIVSETHIEPLRDDGYIIYPFGHIAAVSDGKREAYMLWGNVKQVAQTSAQVIIEFAATAEPAIEDYDTVYAPSFGQYPKMVLLIYDDDGNEMESQSVPVRFKTAGQITRIAWDLGGEFSGKIILYK